MSANANRSAYVKSCYQFISHHFLLEEISDAMMQARSDRRTVKKMVLHKPPLA